MNTLINFRCKQTGFEKVMLLSQQLCKCTILVRVL